MRSLHPSNQHHHSNCNHMHEQLVARSRTTGNRTSPWCCGVALLAAVQSIQKEHGLDDIQKVKKESVLEMVSTSLLFLHLRRFIHPVIGVCDMSEHAAPWTALYLV